LSINSRNVFYFFLYESSVNPISAAETSERLSTRPYSYGGWDM
jgi:hypothetical protein